MKKKIVVLLTLALALCLSITACGPASSSASGAPSSSTGTAASVPAQTPAENGPKPIIAVMCFDYTNNYVTYIRNAIESVAGEDVDLQLVDAQNDQAKQVEQIDLMINKGAKVLCVNAVDPSAAATIISKAKAADIPVVFFNRSPSAEDMNSYEKCWYVGTTPQDSGRMQAEMAMEAFQNDASYDKNGDGKLQYVILKGTLGHPDAEARTTAVQETFEKNNFATELLDVQTGDFKTATAKDVTDVWLGKYGDQIEMILSNNDAMMLGAIESAKTKGYFGAGDGKMGAIGINALPEVLDMIDNGVVIGSILSDAFQEGYSIYTMAYNLANGADVMQGIDGQLGDMKDLRIPYVPIEKSNLDYAREMYSKILR